MIVFTWDVPCAKCGAAAREKCRNQWGNLLKFHRARTQAAAVARAAEFFG